jgi:hypothetical protein
LFVAKLSFSSFLQPSVPLSFMGLLQYLPKQAQSVCSLVSWNRTRFTRTQNNNPS